MTAELNDVLDRTESDELKKEVVYWKARIGMVTARGDAAKVRAVDEFIALDPKAARGGEYLATLVSKYIVSPDAGRRFSTDSPHSTDSDTTGREGKADLRARPSASRSIWNSPTRSAARRSR